MSNENNNKIFAAVGKKKSSIARVFIQEGNGTLLIRKQKKDLNLLTHFAESSHERMLTPLKILDLQDKYNVLCTVKGGGCTSQAEAVGFGIANAILKVIASKNDIEESGRVKKVLRDECYITRDSRKVERKKAGLKKARKAEQFSKR